MTELVILLTILYTGVDLSNIAINFNSSSQPILRLIDPGRDLDELLVSVFATDAASQQKHYQMKVNVTISK